MKPSEKKAYLIEFIRNHFTKFYLHFAYSTSYFLVYSTLISENGYIKMGQFLLIISTFALIFPKNWAIKQLLTLEAKNHFKIFLKIFYFLIVTNVLRWLNFLKERNIICVIWVASEQ